MIYLDSAATSFHKPPEMARGMLRALKYCANPGRGGYEAAREAAEEVFRCRERAGRLFDCGPEQVVFTANCTQGLNTAIRSLVKPGDPVVISGFEHNAVLRPLHALGSEIRVAGRRLFHWEDTLEEFEKALEERPKAAVFTHVSNVFGYILPVEQMARMCRERGIPFILDAAQSAGTIPISFEKLGAAFIAMPGHKGLLGPQGTGLLLCRDGGEPLLYGGTGSDSLSRDMPEYLPERLEAGTLNVPGIAGLSRSLEYLMGRGVETLGRKEQALAHRCAQELKGMGLRVFSGTHQSGVVSFLPDMDCEEAAALLADRGFATRAGLHCAPLAHEGAGTLQTGTVRVSFGHWVDFPMLERFILGVYKLVRGKR